jgi:hypothetical protein
MEILMFRRSTTAMPVSGDINVSTDVSVNVVNVPINVKCAQRSQ